MGYEHRYASSLGLPLVLEEKLIVFFSHLQEHTNRKFILTTYLTSRCHLLVIPSR